MGQFLPPDHSKGDPNTIGGYAAVHGRPAAFEGKDGASYSAEIVVDAIVGSPIVCRDAAMRPSVDQRIQADEHYGAYLMFVCWGYGTNNAIGHLETDYLAFAPTEHQARAKLGTIPLNDAKSHLDRLISAR